MLSNWSLSSRKRDLVLSTPNWPFRASNHLFELNKWSLCNDCRTLDQDDWPPHDDPKLEQMARLSRLDRQNALTSSHQRSSWSWWQLFPVHDKSEPWIKSSWWMRWALVSYLSSDSREHPTNFFHHVNTYARENCAQFEWSQTQIGARMTCMMVVKLTSKCTAADFRFGLTRVSIMIIVGTELSFTLLYQEYLVRIMQEGMLGCKTTWGCHAFWFQESHSWNLQLYHIISRHQHQVGCCSMPQYGEIKWWEVVLQVSKNGRSGSGRKKRSRVLEMRDWAKMEKVLTSRAFSFLVLSWSHFRILQIWWDRTDLQGPQSPQLFFFAQPGHSPHLFLFFLLDDPLDDEDPFVSFDCPLLLLMVVPLLLDPDPWLLLEPGLFGEYWGWWGWDGGWEWIPWEWAAPWPADVPWGWCDFSTWFPFMWSICMMLPFWTSLPPVKLLTRTGLLVAAEWTGWAAEVWTDCCWPAACGKCTDGWWWTVDVTWGVGGNWPGAVGRIGYQT